MSNIVVTGFTFELTDVASDLFYAIAYEEASASRLRHPTMTEFRRVPNWPTATLLVEMGLIRKTRRREPMSYRSKFVYSPTDLGMQIAMQVWPDIAKLFAAYRESADVKPEL